MSNKIYLVLLVFIISGCAFRGNKLDQKSQQQLNQIVDSFDQNECRVPPKSNIILKTETTTKTQHIDIHMRYNFLLVLYIVTNLTKESNPDLLVYYVLNTYEKNHGCSLYIPFWVILEDFRNLQENIQKSAILQGYNSNDTVMIAIEPKPVENDAKSPEEMVNSWKFKVLPNNIEIKSQYFKSTIIK